MADDAVVPTAKKRRREDYGEVVYPIVDCEQVDSSAVTGCTSPLPLSSSKRDQSRT